MGKTVQGETAKGYVAVREMEINSERGIHMIEEPKYNPCSREPK